MQSRVLGGVLPGILTCLAVGGGCGDTATSDSGSVACAEDGSCDPDCADDPDCRGSGGNSSFGTGGATPGGTAGSGPSTGDGGTLPSGGAGGAMPAGGTAGSTPGDSGGAPGGGTAGTPAGEPGGTSSGGHGQIGGTPSGEGGGTGGAAVGAGGASTLGGSAGGLASAGSAGLAGSGAAAPIAGYGGVAGAAPFGGLAGAEPAHVCEYNYPCQTPDDCCGMVPAPYSCNQDFPFLFECLEGYCDYVGCSDDSQCTGHRDITPSLRSHESLGCQAGVCEYAIPCVAVADCCAVAPDGYTCNQDFPHLYECTGGFCQELVCTEDSQCDVYFANTQAGNGYDNLGCINGACVFLRPCETQDDCCSAPREGFTCGEDYPYRYRCIRGYCYGGGCTDDTQCSTFFELVRGPAGYEDFGCQ